MAVRLLRGVWVGKISPDQSASAYECGWIHLKRKPAHRTSDLCQLTRYDLLDEW